MKKIVIFAFISLGFFTSQLQSISLEQYIAQHGMPQVQNGVLNLSNQDLTDLGGLQNIPNIDKVAALILRGNRLGDNPLGTVSPTIFCGLHNLNDLDLRNNQLQELPATVFDNMPNLRLLDLKNNQLQDLPASIFNNLHNLHTLVLSDNYLKMFSPTIFNGLCNLQVLLLENNQLQALLVTIFSTVPNLRSLYLGSNQLQKLPHMFFNTIPNLQILDLSNNAFTLDFIPKLAHMVHSMQNLEYFNGKQKNQALRQFPFTTLKQVTAENIAKNIETHRHRLLDLPVDVLDQLPLPQQERSKFIADKIAQNIDQYRNILHLLRQDILDLLPLTLHQRTGIAAEKRLMGQ